MTTPLQSELVRTIQERGPLPFDRYMAEVLYHPQHGYYGSGAARTGWEGDFLTSPEVDPAFGELWAKAIEDIWTQLGRPESFEVVEVGPGEGGLAAAILAGLSDQARAAFRYTVVERTPESKSRQEQRLAGLDVRWVGALDALEPIAAGCIVLHEIFDNLPVKVFERHGDDWTEIHVGERDGGLIELPVPADNPAGLENRNIAGAERIEVHVGANEMLATIDALLGKGAVIVVDYGYLSAADHPYGTLACYSAAGVDDDPLAQPGNRDITVHVDWSWLSGAMTDRGWSVNGPRSQADVLRELGSPEIDERLKREHAAALERGDGAAALRALSRRQAIGALVDRSGLGGLDVMVAARGLTYPLTWMEPVT